MAKKEILIDPVEFPDTMRLGHESPIERRARWKREEQREKQMAEIKRIIKDRLTVKQRAVVERFLTGMTIRQIAADLKIDPKSAWNRMYGKDRNGGAIGRIRKSLLGCYDEYNP